jgi:hypothetical protein
MRFEIFASSSSSKLNLSSSKMRYEMAEGRKWGRHFSVMDKSVAS